MARLLATPALLAEPARREGATTRHGVAWSLLGRFAYGACQFGLLVAITRLGDAADIGAFSLALALTAPPMVFANLQLRSLYATDVDDRFGWTSYLRVRRIATALALAVCFVSIAALGLHGVAAWAVFFVALSKASETISDLHHGVFQRFARMDRFGQSMTARGLGSVLAVVLALVLDAGLPVALAAMAVWWLVVQLAFDAPHADALRPRDDRETKTAPLVLQGLPLGAVFLIDSLHQNVPRYFVEATLGNEALGLFTPMAYVVVVGSAFVFAQAAPRAPLLARAFTRGDAAGFRGHLVAICRRTGALGLAGIVAALLLGRVALDLLFGAAWAAHADAFVWIAIGGALHFVMVPLVIALTAARALRVQLVCYGSAFAAATLASWILLPAAGLVGAAQAGVCGMAIGVTTALLAVRRVLPRIGTVEVER